MILIQDKEPSDRSPIELQLEKYKQRMQLLKLTDSWIPCDATLTSIGMSSFKRTILDYNTFPIDV